MLIDEPVAVGPDFVLSSWSHDSELPPREAFAAEVRLAQEIRKNGGTVEVERTGNRNRRIDRARRKGAKVFISYFALDDNQYVLHVMSLWADYDGQARLREVLPNVVQQPVLENFAVQIKS